MCSWRTDGWTDSCTLWQKQIVFIPAGRWSTTSTSRCPEKTKSASRFFFFLRLACSRQAGSEVTHPDVWLVICQHCSLPSLTIHPSHSTIIQPFKGKKKTKTRSVFSFSFNHFSCRIKLISVPLIIGQPKKDHFSTETSWSIKNLYHVTGKSTNNVSRFGWNGCFFGVKVLFCATSSEFSEISSMLHLNRCPRSLIC